MFYTNTPNSGTIIPKLGSISAYQGAIKDGQKKLDDLNHQQYLLMLKNDIPGMDALDEPIKKAEQDIDNLKIGLGDIMGAGIHGKSGNQLTGSGWFGRVMDELSPDGTAAKQADALRAPNMGEMPANMSTKPGLDIGNSRPLFAANETKAYVTGVNDAEESLIGGESPETEHLKRILEGIRESSKKGKLNEFLEDNGLDISALTEVPNKLKMEMGVSNFNEYYWSLLEKDDENTDGPYFEAGGPMFTAAPSLLDQNKGVAQINGKDIPIAISNYGGYEDFSGITKETTSFSFDKRSIWDIISHFGISAGSKYDETKQENYTPAQGGVTGVTALIDAAQNVLNAKRHFDINVNTVDVEGKDGVVITYYENIKDVINIFGPGNSTMTKMQSEDRFGATTGYLFDKNYQYIDEKHLDNNLTGYLYTQDGKLMAKPIRYLNDKIVRKGQDITSQFFQLYEVDVDAAILIDAKLKEQGIDLGLNMDYYDKE